MTYLDFAPTIFIFFQTQVVHNEISLRFSTKTRGYRPSY